MPTTHHVQHGIDVEAPAELVFEMLAEVENWPVLFPPTIHVRRLEQDGDTELIQIWATANGQPKTWTSRRQLDPEHKSITFRQTRPVEPIASMGGRWIVEQQVESTSSRVTLLHDYEAIGDDESALAWIAQAVDSNSRAELAALKASIETGTEEGRTFTFEDTVRVHAAPSDVYDFLNEADQWQERLPHVVDVTLTESEPGLQLLRMETRTTDGSSHVTTSVRVCTSPTEIIYKQTQVPALMTVHTGRWSLIPEEDGVAVTSRHTVVLNADNIHSVLGPHAGMTEAREYISRALSANSMATLQLAKVHGERSD